ncbi:MAG: SMP-30/gluconolactonase/LRE family protein [Leifsonia sp.]|nr:SMP-30/gluconolactonase/LRE family protein [Leifsonia sp.]
MSGLLAEGASLEKLWTGTAWGEGPVWLPAEGVLVWSDIPHSRVLQYDAGTVTVRHADAEYANGRTLDRDGAIVQCSHGRRAIEREVDGMPVVVVDRWAGGRFNSPNDVVVARDGAIWFTDPPYGLHESGAEGHPGSQDYDGCYVFRYADGVAEPVITDMVHPNGLAFSPDESLLYVADTAWFWQPEVTPVIRVYDTTTWQGRVFATPSGVADGFRVDTLGRVWTSCGESVRVYSPEGEVLLDIPVPERVGNLCFGGPDGHDLYIAAGTSLYRVATTATDAA